MLSVFNLNPRGQSITMLTERGERGAVENPQGSHDTGEIVCKRPFFCPLEGGGGQDWLKFGQRIVCFKKTWSNHSSDTVL